MKMIHNTSVHIIDSIKYVYDLQPLSDNAFIAKIYNKYLPTQKSDTWQDFKAYLLNGYSVLVIIYVCVYVCMYDIYICTCILVLGYKIVSRSYNELYLSSSVYV